MGRIIAGSPTSTSYLISPYSYIKAVGVETRGNLHTLQPSAVSRWTHLSNVIKSKTYEHASVVAAIRIITEHAAQPRCRFP